MNSAIHRFGLPTFVSVIALLCVLLAAVMIQVGASNDLAGKKPSVELQLSKTAITLPCPLGMRTCFVPAR
jgi:hypothetical protein